MPSALYTALPTTKMRAMNDNPDYTRNRLYVEGRLAAGEKLLLPSHQYHYLADVLRSQEGDAIALFNGSDGEWLGRFFREGKKAGGVRVERKLGEQREVPDIWLVFAPIKNQAIEYLVQKATELGVSKLIPVKTDYAQMKRVNNERLERNAIEAAEQTGRSEVPQIAEMVDLPTLLAGWPAERTLCYGDESGKGLSARELGGGALKQPLALLIGPEGGFSPNEHYILSKSASAKAISLGPRVLRAETAAVAGLTLLMLYAGDWDQHPRFGHGNTDA